VSGVTAKLTDVSNAERLVALHGADLRYVGTWSKGLAWDGARWPLDDEGNWQRAAINTSRVLVEEALDAVREAAQGGDEAAMKRAKADLAKAIATQASNRLAAMVAVARSHRSIIIRHDQLDADPWLLNVKNGTLDLRTGKLRPHAREDLITKLAPVAYDPKATAPTWDAFLGRAMGGSQDLVDFLARIVGYALTGDVREHVLAFFFGGGANGKSTFLSTMHAMLGDYASPAPRGLLFRARGERHPTELATLHGRRFVTCSEIEEGLSFDEALVKDLTGGDPISCRRMGEDFWSYAPTHKLFLAGNHKPAVRGDDEGIWRRMRLVPWVVTIPETERDRALPEKLRAELPGILAWAVRGCLAWQAKGLDAPEAVHAATRAYREENDGIGEFFRLHVVFDPAATIARRTLREAYENFCEENGAQALGAKRFAGRLREHGVTETKVRTPSPRDGWRGVRLATDTELLTATAWGARSEVVTRSDQFPVTRDARAHKDSDRNSGTTTHYATTDDDEERQSIIGEGFG
jgi:putative DNA primase/helicase